jgi:hypothetical protein
MSNSFTSVFSPGGGGTDATKLPLTGGTLTGSLVISSGDYISSSLSATSLAFSDSDSGGSLLIETPLTFNTATSLRWPVADGSLISDGSIWPNANPIGWNDVLLYRSSAATLQLGTNHASTATAQTIKAHNVTTGTGADLILKGGTGSVANGVVRFGVRTALATEIISGYITIKDEGGTLRKLAVIS